jgi:GAF domain-containing protein
VRQPLPRCGTRNLLKRIRLVAPRPGLRRKVGKTAILGGFQKGDCGGGIALKWATQRRGSIAKAAKIIVTDRTTKTTLDAQTFQKVLEAAFVLQEHNRKLQKAQEIFDSRPEHPRQESVGQTAQPKATPKSDSPGQPNTDYTLTLAEIVEAQHYIRTQRLDVEAALNVVADRLMRITKASGAGIGILNGANVHYRAGAGSAALPVGSEVPLAVAVSQPTVRTGQVIRTVDIDIEFLFDPASVRDRGIRSLVAVPIHYDGEIVGGLELYFDKVHGYADQDIHTCQLMAGLVTEALAREAGVKLKKSMAEERSSMRAALEKLEPNLAALAKDPPVNPISAELAVEVDNICWKCANLLSAGEQFCGNCGAVRAGSAEEAAAIDSSLDSAGLAQPELEKKTKGRSFKTAAASGTAISRVHAQASVSAVPDNEVLPDDVLAMFAMTEAEENSFDSSAATIAEETIAENDDRSIESPADLQTGDAAAPSQIENSEKSDESLLVWSSAARAQDFLESLSVTRTPSALVRFWRFRRGDFYLAIAIAVVVAVIGWGIWSSHSPTGAANIASRTAKRARHSPPDSDLSMFDRLLIDLGLAEAPDPAPEYKGNPDVQVWVDLNTAEYYCPGADLYQKTRNGKLATQREAELDQFEPAYRKACD